jgi:hypothetical protein
MSPVFSFRQDIDPSQLFEAQIQTFSFAWLPQCLSFTEWH